jgi:hypothetical protein
VTAAGETEVAFDFTSNDLRAENLLRFEFATPRSPKALGVSSDDRQLGIGLRSMKLHRLP